MTREHRKLAPDLATPIFQQGNLSMRISLPHAVLVAAVAIAAGGCKEPESMPQPVQAPVAVATAPSTVTGTPALRMLDAAEIARELEPSSLCNLEYLGDQAFAGQDLAAHGVARLAGWVGAEDTRQAPSGAMVRFESSDKAHAWEASISLGVKREDVVSALSEPGLVTAGFLQDVPLAGLPAGRYHLYVSYVSGQHHYACDNGRYVVVSG